MDAKELIARRVALELKNGDVVNLGIGLPTKVANYVPHGIEVTFQSENGFLGLGAITEPDSNLVNAGGQACGMVPGAAMFDSAFSFALIRGGHVDVCVLGGLQVDEHGSLANWMVPGKWCRHGRRDGSGCRREEGHYRPGTLRQKWRCEAIAPVHLPADRRQ